MKGMERWLSALSFTGGGVILAVKPELTSRCFFCALSSAFSSPLSSASAPSSWWLFHFIVIPSTPSSALPLPSQDCPFTSSSSECQNTNDLTASEGLWHLPHGTSRFYVCQLLQRWTWKMERCPSNEIPSLTK